MNFLLSVILLAGLQDDVADIPSLEQKAGQDPQKTYFLVGPKEEAVEPEKGWGLVVVLPGGDGGAAFNPFVRRIYKHAVPKDLLLVQLVSVEWQPGQFKALVWPTKSNPAPGMKFTTEEFVEAVLVDVKKSKKIDPARIHLLAWSSGGPPAYVLSLAKPKVFRGSVIAMSVFRPDALDLKAAAGRSLFLYQSPDDRVTPFFHAEKAYEQVLKHGGRAKLVPYEGGHGWKGPIYPTLRDAFEWLEKP